MSEATWCPYVPVAGRPWRLTMGLRALDPARWFEFGPDAPAQLATKADLVASRRDEVVVVTPAGATAATELSAMVAANLAQFHPSRAFGDDPEPLVAASLAVLDDLCVLEKIDEGWRLTAACVCFPSRWRLADKVLATLDEIHAPVPHYDESLAAPTTRFFDRLEVGRAMWRLNWTLLDDDTLFQPSSSRHAPAADPDTWCFRVERQSLVRLPDSRAVAFTIRTYVARALELASSVEGFVDGVGTVLETAPADTRAYKGWETLASRWREWFA